MALTGVAHPSFAEAYGMLADYLFAFGCPYSDGSGRYEAGMPFAVEAGLGVGMVSRYAVESECQAGVLRRVPIEGWRLTRTMNLVYRAQKYFSPWRCSPTSQDGTRRPAAIERTAGSPPRDQRAGAKGR